MIMRKDPRQTTSHVGFLNKPNPRALMRGLNRSYYSININYRKDRLVEQMLLNLRRTQWFCGLEVAPFQRHSEASKGTLHRLASLSKKFSEDILEEVSVLPTRCACV